MGTDGFLKLTAFGTLKNNSGSGRVHPRVRLKLGSTTIGDIGTGATDFDNNAATWEWQATAWIMNAGAANSQVTHLEVQYGFASTTATGYTVADGFGVGFTPAHSGGASVFRGAATDTAAEDTSSSKLLQLTVVLPVADANCFMTLYGALVEVM